MSWILTNIHRIMFVSGALTLTMITRRLRLRLRFAQRSQKAWEGRWPTSLFATGAHSSP
jgi:hypothetical protein